MALDCCISPKNDCKTLVLTDNRGVESATNTNGWGLSNPISSVASATFLIELRNSDETYSTLNTVNVYDTLPNVLGEPYLLTSIDFDLVADTIIPDGIYRGTYSVYDDTDTLLATCNKNFVVVCSIKCCYKKLSDKVSNVKCDTGIKQKYSEMSILMRALDAAIEFGDLISINNMIEYISKLCASCNCQCGCN